MTAFLCILLSFTHRTQDSKTLHDKLAEADPCFKSVPIDDSEDSYNLRSAHAQRVISTAICEHIWKPFHSELTINHEFSSLLSKISGELDKSSSSGRAAKVWAALTMQALQSLQASAMSSPNGESREDLRPTVTKTAENIISAVTRLSPLVNPSQNRSLEGDLLKLINMSVNVWNDAYAGGFKLIVSSSLDRAHREEWRSQQFDPASSPPLHRVGTDPESISNTHPRIFTLFPRIMAHGDVDLVKEDKGPPGSWPKEPEKICIHRGVGLPEWSKLVVIGKDEQAKKEEYYSNLMKNADRELRSTRRGSEQGRRVSKGSMSSSPPSPSAQWKRESTMKLDE